MSRVGLKPITLPDKVSVDVAHGMLTVKGPKGTVVTPVPGGVRASLEDRTLRFQRENDQGPIRARHGLARALAANAVQGVTSGFERRLEIVGVGFRASVSGRKVQLSLGYSHPVEYVPPDGVTVTIEENNQIVVRGVDKQAVGQVAAHVRGLRPPDAYKGKGIRYAGEAIKLKPGKSGAK
jgi:large subunit ribosomal protein L6